jgi:hypothetical protein
MRKQIAHVATVVAVAAVAAACGGGGVAGGQEGGSPRRVKLDGCVQAAPGIHQYTLQSVLNPVTAAQPNGNASPQEPLVPDGSWVRLTRRGEDLDQYLGRRVEVEGPVTDTGATTIGTAGQEDEKTKLRRASPDASSTTDRSVPPSTVPPRGATANGIAPLIAVEQIRTIADTCLTEHERVREGHTGIGKRRAPREDDPAPGSHR